MMIAETSRQRAELLGGAPVAEAIKTEVAAEVERLFQTYNFRPCLAAVRVGTDPASEVYVGNKIKTSREIGLISEHHALPETTSHAEVLRLVQDLNRREDVDGILVQLPLPAQINANEILESIAPEKDVDGFHPINVGRLASGLEGLTPCTPAGVIELLKRNNIEIRGSQAVVVGRSNIVGRPMAQMLLNEDATVTICHSRTGNLPEVTRQADILVAAIGKPAFVRGEHIKPGAAVIDVGINRISDVDLARDYFDETEIEKRLAAIEKRGSTIIGDVHPREAMAIAGKFTPVPGGVGLLTVAMLMKNTLKAAKMRRLSV
ncbi:MAG TPA: bifunctional 5,10-methylenetetrahydrofolate dehydrogenase/5,10-methenyltetrahydrofolate cyclohydrolase [Pyrinomonadaceae bacterium]|jgi:methylenetetrahydrofolate dehydrogenase (NADP+)/methenyltetrahydrofolate cyclohydrolase